MQKKALALVCVLALLAIAPGCGEKETKKSKKPAKPAAASQTKSGKPATMKPATKAMAKPAPAKAMAKPAPMNGNATAPVKTQSRY